MCDGPVESIDAFDVDADDEVGSGAAVVHLRRSRVPRAQSLMEHVEQHGRVGDLGHVRSLHPHDPLLVLLDFQFHLPWIPLIPFHLILFRFYNAIINPLRPRLSKLKTIVIAGVTWTAGKIFDFCP